jgi:ascorbate-specific PTS system EIIC-type component UlaA
VKYGVVIIIIRLWRILTALGAIHRVGSISIIFIPKSASLVSYVLNAIMLGNFIYIKSNLLHQFLRKYTSNNPIAHSQQQLYIVLT